MCDDLLIASCTKIKLIIEIITDVLRFNTCIELISLEVLYIADFFGSL